MIDIDASTKQEADNAHEPSVDAVLPYSVPSTAIENIRLFDILHQPQRRFVQGTVRKYNWYSQLVAMLQS
ncbi:hypothetical protein OA099_04700 [Litorivicinus sp.]|nr:hypothetical protein [Litorivicinus sp.]